MIYLYAFTKFAGSDRVFLYPHQDFVFAAGDVVKFGEDYFLVLGEEVAFAEAYHFVQAKLTFTCVSAKFLSKNSLELLHWMVAEYYTSYKNVMRYFVPWDIVSLLAKWSVSGSLPKSLDTTGLDEKLLPFVLDPLVKRRLIVFPDLWSMSMLASEAFRKQKGALVLSSWDAEPKQQKAFWSLHEGKTACVLCTHAEIFLPYKQLDQIIFVDPHTRYYANQQDPRYKTGDVLQKISEIWKCDIKMVGI